MMLHRKYRVPAEGFDFPLFAVRYAVSATEPAEGSAICALLAARAWAGSWRCPAAAAART